MKKTKNMVIPIVLTKTIVSQQGQKTNTQPKKN